MSITTMFLEQSRNECTIAKVRVTDATSGVCELWEASCDGCGWLSCALDTRAAAEDEADDHHCHDSAVDEAWNPFYLDYAAAHGRQAGEQLALDRAGEGVVMSGFTRWIDAAWQLADRETGNRHRSRADADIVVFARWLTVNRDRIGPCP